ncbi:uncharacterized protein LTHEOB_9123 [Neofusicoccum parvum]|uniref:Uncharacterized protein n=1 Tax=Botryosphaeria parva (strain UCR-NP2) TaxID=1287680 RepID=R1GD38_BOTPV|nr:hypothetical protein UCRNP2_9470 [Neofusicoccum parvum UCRNP2]GME51409.1 uncharacterized protein LTHEOB_9123 [Neofusicoccum parvum]
MEPWQSWGLFLTLGAVVYFYYSNNKKTAARPARGQPVAEETAPRPTRKETKPKRKPEAVASGTDAAARVEKPSEPKGRNKKKEQKVAAQAPAVVAQPVADEKDDDADKEWARQLAQLKEGTKLAPPERKDGRSKTVKQRAANADRTFASGSSTNGADADAEVSPALSPALKASSSRDVSDMLEAPAAGPSVLRLTESTNPAPAKKQQKKAAPEPTETKKQRQNRKKAEQAKALREEEEKERKVLAEKQRRTAREARGEPAKNGLSAGPTSAPSVWTQKETPKTNGGGALLDTFEHDGGSTASSANLAASGTSASTAGTNWERDLPSEEEQLRLVMEDSTWSTVETKGKKGKKKTQTEPETEQFAVKTPEVRSLPLTETTNTSRSNTLSSDFEPANGLKASADISEYIQGQVGSHPQDSDWAVV